MVGMCYPGQTYPADGPGTAAVTQTYGAGQTSYPANFNQGAWLAGPEHANDMLVVFGDRNQKYPKDLSKKGE